MPTPRSTRLTGAQAIARRARLEPRVRAVKRALATLSMLTVVVLALRLFSSMAWAGPAFLALILPTFVLLVASFLMDDEFTGDAELDASGYREAAKLVRESAAAAEQIKAWREQEGIVDAATSLRLSVSDLAALRVASTDDYARARSAAAEAELQAARASVGAATSGPPESGP